MKLVSTCALLRVHPIQELGHLNALGEGQLLDSLSHKPDTKVREFSQGWHHFCHKVFSLTRGERLEVGQLLVIAEGPEPGIEVDVQA